MMEEGPAGMEDRMLAAEIERIRTELNHLGESLGLSHPVVLAMSAQLDEMILQYQSMCRSRKGRLPGRTADVRYDTI